MVSQIKNFFRLTAEETSKFGVSGLLWWKPTGGFPSQRASNVVNVSMTYLLKEQKGPMTTSRSPATASSMMTSDVRAG